MFKSTRFQKSQENDDDSGEAPDEKVKAPESMLNSKA